MSPIYIQNNKILIRDGKIAASSDCCCNCYCYEQSETTGDGFGNTVSTCYRRICSNTERQDLIDQGWVLLRGPGVCQEVCDDCGNGSCLGYTVWKIVDQSSDFVYARGTACAEFPDFDQNQCSSFKLYDFPYYFAPYRYEDDLYNRTFVLKARCGFDENNWHTLETKEGSFDTCGTPGWDPLIWSASESWPAQEPCLNKFEDGKQVCATPECPNTITIGSYGFGLQGLDPFQENCPEGQIRVFDDIINENWRNILNFICWTPPPEFPPEYYNTSPIIIGNLGSSRGPAFPPNANWWDSNFDAVLVYGDGNLSLDTTASTLVFDGDVEAFGPNSCNKQPSVVMNASNILFKNGAAAYSFENMVGTTIPFNGIGLTINTGGGTINNSRIMCVVNCGGLITFDQNSMLGHQTMPNNDGYVDVILNLTGDVAAIFDNNSRVNAGAVVNGNVTFDNTSENYGVINGTAEFHNSANKSGGIVKLSALFYGNGLNFVPPTNETGAIVEGDAEFRDAAVNAGTVKGNAVFKNDAYNDGTIEGSAVFENQSMHQTGTIGGNAIFKNGSKNYATILGSAEFYGDSRNYGNVIGQATFYDNSCNVDGQGTAGSFDPDPPPLCPP